MAIKVVLLTPFYEPVKGGVSTFVRNLGLHLTALENSVNIFTLKGRTGGNIEVIGPNKFASTCKAVSKLRKIKPEILHSHSHWSLMIPCIWYKMLHSKTKLVHTLHTEPVKRPGKLKKRMYEFLFSKYDGITFVSEDLKNRFQVLFHIRTKTSVVYSGVSLEEAEEAETRQFVTRYDLEGSFPILLFIGPLSWEMKVKGVKTLISSIKILKREHPDVKLLIVGDGEFKKELEEFAQSNGLVHEVIFTGFLDKTSIPLSASHIYTHISLQEGLPIALLEAMSTGKPVIASKTGGIPEVISHNENGILVNTEPNEIANGISELLANKEKMKILGKNARLKMEKEHDWKIVSQRFFELYKNEN